MVISISTKYVVDGCTSLRELRELISAAQLRISLITETKLNDEEKRLVDADKFIEAIKKLRDRTHFGLTDCKFIADNYRDNKK